LTFGGILIVTPRRGVEVFGTGFFSFSFFKLGERERAEKGKNITGDLG
jgi:hypothetical protein